MKTPTRADIVAQAAKRLKAEFDALSSVPHNALRGHEAEGIVRAFLNAHLPRRFAAGAGFIIDAEDEISPQTDVVIYDAHNCPVLRASDDAAIFPSGNVAAAIEVKSRLTKAELADAWAKISKIKNLALTVPYGFELGSRLTPLGVLFAFACDTKLTTVAENYAELLSVNGIGSHIDVIVVLGRGVIHVGMRTPYIEGWQPALLESQPDGKLDGADIGLIIQDVGDYSLDVFFRTLLQALSMFHGYVDNATTDLQKLPVRQGSAVLYITTLLNETDPGKRDARLKECRERFMSGAQPIPPDFG